MEDVGAGEGYEEGFVCWGFGVLVGVFRGFLGGF